MNITQQYATLSYIYAKASPWRCGEHDHLQIVASKFKFHLVSD